MIRAAQTADGTADQTLFARPARTGPAAAAPDDGRPMLQALAAPKSQAGARPSATRSGVRRANWALCPLGASAFELTSKRG